MKVKTSNKNSKFLFKLISLILLFFISLPAYFAAPWADGSQLYRQEINVTGATSLLENLTHSFIINSSNTGVNFDFSTHRDSLRFYYYNETSLTNTLLSHDTSSWDTTNNNATIIVKIPHLDSGEDANIWAYYGDTSKSNIEDYCSVFIFCDLFDDGVINPRLKTTDQDNVAGTSFSEGGGVLTITAGGLDTWTGSDEYGSVYLEGIEGDIETRVTVNSLTNPNVWAKSGIMIKNNMTQPTISTGYTFNVVTPGNGYSFQRDLDNNGFLDTSTTASSATYPSHLRHIKTGNSHTGYYSQTTQNSWILHTTSSITSTNPIQDIGISLTSHAGSTTATSTYDNFTVRRYTTDTISQTFGSEEKKSNFIELEVDIPPANILNHIIVNELFTINVTLSCLGIDNENGCGNVSGTPYFNNTGTWEIMNTNNNPPFRVATQVTQNCVLGFNTSCTISWLIEPRGNVGDLEEVLLQFSSNNSGIKPVNSSVLRYEIVDSVAVTFNDTSLFIGPILKNNGTQSKSLAIIPEGGKNTNVIVTCDSGDCGVITDNWVDGTDINNNAQGIVDFTCSDNNYGNYSAVFTVTSDEFFDSQPATINCEVNPIYGPIAVSLNQPAPLTTTTVSQNRTFALNASVECTGLCGTIFAYAILEKGDWWNISWEFKRTINYTINDAIPNNYQIYVQLDNTDLGNDFNWSNNCEDVRITRNLNPLNYWIEECDTSAQTLDLWIKTDSALASSSNYSFDIYYGNEFATTLSNASSTFREDEIHLVTGRCPVANGACNYSDNVGDGETIRANINTTNWEIDGLGYINEIDYIDNPYGTDENYYMRFRSLFIPSSTSDYSFGISSDDGSNIGLWKGDGYGFGLSTPTTLTSSQDIVADWYGGHAGGTCGSSAAIERTRTLNQGEGYWIDFTMQETAGGQEAEMCISENAGAFNTFGATSFSGEFFSRNYVENEPSLSSISEQDSIRISTNSAETPFYSLSPQPQSCVPSEDGSCSFEWDLNATGLINSSWNISAIFLSNNPNIESKKTQITTINISSVQERLTLISPINNTKILTNQDVEFSWDIESPSFPIPVNIYLNGVLNDTTTCTSSGTCSINLSLNSGEYDWFVEANNSGNTFTSETNTFWKISNYSASISKTITGGGAPDIYNIGIEIENNLDDTGLITPIDFVVETFNPGSFNQAFDFSEAITSSINGTIIGWDLALSGNSNQNLNYSITKNTQSYHLLEEYIIGLD